MKENTKSTRLYEDRHVRADARRNLARLLKAAREVFDTSGLDAPVREIAERAGVGVGTLYRHFPRREELIAAVFHKEIDDCVEAATGLAAENPPFDALIAWLRRFVVLAQSKQGIAQVFTLEDPAFAAFGPKRDQGLRPAFRLLFQAAVGAGEIRSDIDADEFLDAVAILCATRPDNSQHMVALLADGLRIRDARSVGMG